VPLTLFAENLLETATVSAPVVDLFPLSRLYDRDQGPPYIPDFEQAWTPFYDIVPLPVTLDGPALAQIDIDMDLGSAKTVSAWALVNHNLTGVTVTLFAGSSFPPGSTIDSLDPAGATFLRSFATQTLRYWRLRIPAMAVAPQIGELMLGVPREISLGPLREDGTIEILVNVVRDRTPAGHAQATKRGPRRVALPCHWNALPDADRLSFTAALDDLSDSARNLLIRDPLGVLRWVSWVLSDDRLKFTRAADNIEGRHWAFETVFEEAL
jgi:hypothetical protein